MNLYFLIDIYLKLKLMEMLLNLKNKLTLRAIYFNIVVIRKEEFHD